MSRQKCTKPKQAALDGDIPPLSTLLEQHPGTPSPASRLPLRPSGRTQLWIFSPPSYKPKWPGTWSAEAVSVTPDQLPDRVAQSKRRAGKKKQNTITIAAHGLPGPTVTAKINTVNATGAVQLQHKLSSQLQHPAQLSYHNCRTTSVLPIAATTSTAWNHNYRHSYAHSRSFSCNCDTIYSYRYACKCNTNSHNHNYSTRKTTTGTATATATTPTGRSIATVTAPTAIAAGNSRYKSYPRLMHYILLRDLNTNITRTDERRIEVIANGLPLWNGSQLAIDTTLVSPLTASAQPRRHQRTTTAAALRLARQAKERTYPELQGGGRARLVVVGLEIGGRWSQEAAALIGSLARHKTQTLPAILLPAAHHAWISRWAAHLSTAAMRAFASSLLHLPASTFYEHWWPRTIPNLTSVTCSRPTLRAPLPPASFPPIPAISTPGCVHIWNLASIKTAQTQTACAKTKKKNMHWDEIVGTQINGFQPKKCRKTVG